MAVVAAPPRAPPAPPPHYRDSTQTSASPPGPTTSILGGPGPYSARLMHQQPGSFLSDSPYTFHCTPPLGKELWGHSRRDVSSAKEWAGHRPEPGKPVSSPRPSCARQGPPGPPSLPCPRSWDPPTSPPTSTPRLTALFPLASSWSSWPTPRPGSTQPPRSSSRSAWGSAA